VPIGKRFTSTRPPSASARAAVSVALITRTKLSQCGCRLAASAGSAFRLARA
jgi:hypothetical protein